MKKSPLILFIGFSAIYLLLLLLNQDSITFWLKTVLIPLLGFVVVNLKPFPTKKLLLTVLFFSWVGDVVLLFANRGAIYFIIGLLAFLIAHILYILLFIKIQEIKSTKYLPYILVVVAYLVGLLTFLWNDLNDLKIPVVIYATVLSTMLLFAIKGTFIWQPPYGKMILLGAIFFVVSDSLLAINKFRLPLPIASFLIMSTYLLAQFLIVYGILKMEQKKEAQN